MKFTIEEENIVAMYYKKNKDQTIADMMAAMPFVETEMRQLLETVIEKIRKSDAVEWQNLAIDATFE